MPALSPWKGVEGCFHLLSLQMVCCAKTAEPQSFTSPELWAISLPLSSPYCWHSPHSSTLAWKIPWTEEAMDMSLSKLRETVMDREAWRAAVHGVAESDMNEATFMPICFPALGGT